MGSYPAFVIILEQSDCVLGCHVVSKLHTLAERTDSERLSCRFLDLLGKHEIDKFLRIFHMFRAFDDLYGFARENSSLFREYDFYVSAVLHIGSSRIFPGKPYGILAVGSAFMDSAGTVQEFPVHILNEVIHIRPSFGGHGISILSLGVKHRHEHLERRAGVGGVAAGNLALQRRIEKIVKPGNLHIARQFFINDENGGIGKRGRKISCLIFSGINHIRVFRRYIFLKKFLLGIQHRLVSRPENIALGIVLFRRHTFHEGACPRHNDIDFNPRFFFKSGNDKIV